MYGGSEVAAVAKAWVVGGFGCGGRGALRNERSVTVCGYFVLKILILFNTLFVNKYYRLNYSVILLTRSSVWVPSKCIIWRDQTRVSNCKKCYSNNLNYATNISNDVFMI